MSPSRIFLITILYDQELIRCVLKIEDINRHKIDLDYPMEDDVRKYLHSLLPLHVRNCGPIVEVTTDLFEVVSVA